jgi:hypothetical protein
VENRTQKQVINKLVVADKLIFKRGIRWQYFFINCIGEVNYFMRSILYSIAVICIVGWLLGVFVWSATGLIHVLIILAAISFLLGIIRKA